MSSKLLIQSAVIKKDILYDTVSVVTQFSLQVHLFSQWFQWLSYIHFTEISIANRPLESEVENKSAIKLILLPIVVDVNMILNINA